MKRYLIPSTVLLIGSLLLHTTFAQPGTVSKATVAPAKERTSTAARPTTVENIEQDMSEAVTLIQDKYVSGKTLDYNEVFKSSIEGMLRSLDPHSNYFDAKEFEQFRNEQNSQYFGIGATIGDLTNGDTTYTYIRATFENSPAYRAGLRYGDKILEVNGTSMAGKTFVEVRSFLRGPRGTPARITVEHYGTGLRETVEIIRDAVPQPSVPEAYMIRPGVGYIAMIVAFNQTTYAEFQKAMRDLKAQGMQQLVLDLRGNGGGLVNQAAKVASTFLNRGQVICTQKGRVEGTAYTYRADNLYPEKMPLIVLVNKNSASASEILAGAMQDHDRALIVGENTFGKGLVQNPFLLDYNSMLLLVIAKYETPSGRLIQRDYSKGDLYDYYQQGGDNAAKGPESRTDSGRVVYGGDGITPDEIVKADTISRERFVQQQKLLSPIFGFALDAAYGKAKGFDSYRVDRPIRFDYDIKAADFPITPDILQSFKAYAVDKFKVPASLIDREKDFVVRNLRTEFVIAAYGSTTSFQVFNEYDNQLLKAIDLLPRAKQLALESEKVKSSGVTNRNNQ